MFNSPRYSALIVTVFVVGFAILYRLGDFGKEAPRLATLLLLFLAHDAIPGIGERLLYAAAFVGPTAYLALTGQSDRISDVVITCVTSTMVFQIGWWHKGQPYALGLAEVVLFLCGGIAVVFFSMTTLMRYERY